MPEFYLNTQNNSTTSGPVIHNHQHYHYHYYGNVDPLPEKLDHSDHKKIHWSAELFKVIFSWLWENLICNWLRTIVVLFLIKAGLVAEDAFNWTDSLISLLTAIFSILLN